MTEDRLDLLGGPHCRSPLQLASPASRGHGDRHFDCSELDRALANVGMQVRWIPIRRGGRWWLHQVKAFLTGNERFSFPLIVAGKP